MNKRVRHILLGLSLAFYVVACLTTALIFKQSGTPEEPMPGWNVLAVGWVAVFVGQFGWFANPFLLTGLICGFLRLFRVGSGAVAIGLGISVISIAMLFNQELPANEGNVGPPLKLTGLGIGCWLWLLAQLLVLIANVAGARGLGVDKAQPNKSEVA